MKSSIPELLAPAGGPEQFDVALAAGADAIYCGFGNTFNARRGAQSFTSKTFGEACRRAHLVGSRVYVTVNVAIRGDEMPTVLALIRRAWLLGADAFIIQDWGLLTEVTRRWPEVECHLSTQANVHDARGTLWSAEKGVARVTLSRELSLAEVRTIAQTGVDLECFAHGALCFCYSGVCSLSSSAGDRSANRGMCAQPCRLPYDLVDGRGNVLSAPDRGRPLCPKDHCTIDDLAELRDAGAASLKMEGRLKSSDYVYAVVSAYRAGLDELAQGNDFASDGSKMTRAERYTLLKRAFNRDFTDAYLRGTSGDELMSYERSNNRGELVGEVVSSRTLGKVKVRRGGTGGGRERLRTMKVAEVEVVLHKQVGEGDLLELRPQDDPSQFLTAHAPHDAQEGDVITCRTSRAVPQGSLVRVIRSKAALDAAARAAAREIPRKRKVRVRVSARLGEPFKVCLECADGSASACAVGDVVEPARTRTVSESDLIDHVGRMGNSWFEPLSFEVELDAGCGMGFSAVHAVRNAACAALEEEILRAYEERDLAPAPSEYALHKQLESHRASMPKAMDEVEVCVLVADAASARAAYEAGAQRVYAPSDVLSTGSWPQEVIPLLDEVCREGDHARLDSFVHEDKPCAIGNVSELALAQERGARAEVRGCIPVHNEWCLATLESAGAAGFWMSPELTLQEIERLTTHATVPVGVVVYGARRAMTSEHCVLQVANRCIHDCKRCALRKSKDTYLRNDAGDLLPVRTDIQGRSRIYAAHTLDAVPELDAILNAGVTRLGVDATLLTPREVLSATSRLVRALAGLEAGRTLPAREKDATTGHLFSAIA